jgi:hypothetical protein
MTIDVRMWLAEVDLDTIDQNLQVAITELKEQIRLSDAQVNARLRNFTTAVWSLVAAVIVSLVGVIATLVTTAS